MSRGEGTICRIEFDHARVHYQRTLLARRLTLILLFFISFLIVPSLVDSLNKKKKTQQKIALLEKARDSVSELGGTLAEFKPLSVKVTQKIFDDFVKDLRQQFINLEYSIIPFIDDEIFQNELNIKYDPSGEKFSAIQSKRQRYDIIDLPDDVKKIVRDANSSDELRRVLADFIDQDIIKPQFRALNERWDLEVVKKSTTLFETLSPALSILKKHPIVRDRALEVEKSVHEIMNKVKHLKFSPPEKSKQKSLVKKYWWETVDAKVVLARGYANEAQSAINTLRIGQDMHEMEAALSKAFAAEEQLKNELDKQIKSIQVQFNSVLENLNGLTGLPNSLSIDFLTILPYFPLLAAFIFLSLTYYEKEAFERYTRCFQSIMEFTPEGIIPALEKDRIPQFWSAQKRSCFGQSYPGKRLLYKHAAIAFIQIVWISILCVILMRAGIWTWGSLFLYGAAILIFLGLEAYVRFKMIQLSENFFSDLRAHE